MRAEGSEHLLTVTKIRKQHLLLGVRGTLPRPRFVSPPNSQSLTPGVQPGTELLREPFLQSLTRVGGCSAMLAGLRARPGDSTWCSIMVYLPLRL